MQILQEDPKTETGRHWNEHYYSKLRLERALLFYMKTQNRDWNTHCYSIGRLEIETGTSISILYEDPKQGLERALLFYRKT